jgi:hypothetical protein
MSKDDQFLFVVALIAITVWIFLLGESLEGNL